MVGLSVRAPGDHPQPLLGKEGNQVSILRHSGELKDHGVWTLFPASASADCNRLALVAGIVKRKVHAEGVRKPVG